jgi:acetyl-CoA carboxylase carboxyltransferase component
MGPAQATNTLLDVMIASFKKQGREPDAAELDELRTQVAADYERQTDIRYAAARLWVDAILDPAETRSVLIQSLEVATRHASDEPFRVGVYQV